MNTGKRILWIDYAKSICIYLVLLGHAHASQPVTDFIYTFHMPLFFFLSGCLFSFEKHPNFKEFAIKRFKGLMVPYLWINLITYLFWLFAGRNFGEDATISTTWYSPIIGGILCGSGIGLVFVSNGSTGGTDIIAAIVNKYKNISFAKMMMYIDFLIIACSYVLFHSVEKMIFGYVVMGVMSYTMDMLINGKRQSVQILVLSDKYEEIATHVNNDIRRGVTVIDGMGWYSKQPKKVLMILAKRNESVKIFRLIKSIDPKAFISQSNVVGVYGEGFDKIKA